MGLRFLALKESIVRTGVSSSPYPKNIQGGGPGGNPWAFEPCPGLLFGAAFRLCRIWNRSRHPGADEDSGLCHISALLDYVSSWALVGGIMSLKSFLAGIRRLRTILPTPGSSLGLSRLRPEKSLHTAQCRVESGDFCLDQLA